MRGRLFRVVTAKDVLLMGVLIATITFITHFTVSNPLGMARVLYPLQALIAQHQYSCSSDAPKWLSDGLRYATRSQGSLANQIAYMEPNGRLHHCENGWVEDFFTSSKVSPNTRFRYASITKLFTADAVLRLVNSGRLRLDAPLVSILPEIRTAKDERVNDITIRHLLNHSAGFDRTKGLDPMFRLNTKPWCPYDVSELSGRQLSFAPGSRHEYSNSGYCLLGVVIEQVTGRPFRDFIADSYALEGRGIRFIDGPYLPDEVKYDFRNSNFYGEDYYKFFDFQANSATAGLSGSAAALAESISSMLTKAPNNLLSGEAIPDCDKTQLRECIGHAVDIYQPKDSGTEFFLHGGFLAGNVTLAVIDKRGGVTVWLSSGRPLKGFEQTKRMYGFIFQALNRHYQS